MGRLISGQTLFMNLNVYYSIAPAYSLAGHSNYFWWFPSNG